MTSNIRTVVPLISLCVVLAAVNAADNEAVNTDMMMIPTMIHIIAKIRPGMERTVLSPYLGIKK